MNKDLFFSPFFQAIIIPLVFVLIGINANRLGRRDGDDAPKINDFAVGTTVFLTMLGTISSDFYTVQEGNLQLIAGWLPANICFLFISIDNDRNNSWKKDQQGLPTEHKHIIRGVIIPLLISLIIFGYYQYTKVLSQ